MTSQSFYTKYDDFVAEECGRDSKKGIEQWAKERVIEARSMGMPLPSKRPVTMETQMEMEALSTAYPSLFRELLVAGRHIQIPHAIRANIDVALAREDALAHARAIGGAMPMGVLVDDAVRGIPIIMGIRPTDTMFRDAAHTEPTRFRIRHEGGRTVVVDQEGNAHDLGTETSFNRQRSGRGSSYVSPTHERQRTRTETREEEAYRKGTKQRPTGLRGRGDYRGGGGGGGGGGEEPDALLPSQEYLGGNDPAREAYAVKQYKMFEHYHQMSHERAEEYRDEAQQRGRPVEHSSLRVERKNKEGL